MSGFAGRWPEGERSLAEIRARRRVQRKSCFFLQLSREFRVGTCRLGRGDGREAVGLVQWGLARFSFFCLFLLQSSGLARLGRGEIEWASARDQPSWLRLLFLFLFLLFLFLFNSNLNLFSNSNLF